MCRRVHTTLPPTPGSASTARSFAAETLTRWGLPSLIDEVTLPISELVTNVILHARTPLTLSLDVADAMIEVAVHDNDPRRPIVRPVRLDLLAEIDRAAAGQLVDGESGHPDAEHAHRSLHIGESGSIAAGRGMIIVDAVADEWGVADRLDGKDVWFRIAIPEQWQLEHACSCADAADRMASGHPIRHVAGEWDQQAG